MNQIDNTQVIEDEILPKVKEIIAICNKNKIPFFCSVLEKDDGTTSSYRSDLLSPDVLGIDISQDNFKCILKAMAEGYSSYNDVIEMDL